MEFPFATEINGSKMKLIAGDYAEQLSKAEWTAKRLEILERDGHACRSCGTQSELQVHHRQYHWHKGYKVAPWCYASKYLITLCKDCHKTGHLNFNIPAFSI